MQENLVIVESPAKAKTIEKFLGKDYIVKSSFGHIRDLSKKDLGINIDDEFRPVYEIPGDKKKVVDELTKLIEEATGLIQFCSTRLTAIDKEVSQLLQQLDESQE